MKANHNDSVSVKNKKRADSELHESFKKFDKLEFVILIANDKIWRVDRITMLMLKTNDLHLKLHELFTPKKDQSE